MGAAVVAAAVVGVARPPAALTVVADPALSNTPASLVPPQAMGTRVSAPAAAMRARCARRAVHR